MILRGFHRNLWSHTSAREAQAGSLVIACFIGGYCYISLPVASIRIVVKESHMAFYFSFFGLVHSFLLFIYFFIAPASVDIENETYCFGG